MQIISNHKTNTKAGKATRQPVCWQCGSTHNLIKYHNGGVLHICKAHAPAWVK